MKKYTYYTRDDKTGDFEIGYWNATNYRTAKKEIFDYYKFIMLKNKDFHIIFIAEIKYEEEEE